MALAKLIIDGQTMALVTGEKPVVTDVQSALELAMSARYELDTDRLIIDKRAVCEDFFILSTGLAGEILQKFINYQVKIAIYGDFSGYTSKPLRDFIYESNKGRDIFFTATREEAAARLAGRAPV